MTNTRTKNTSEAFKRRVDANERRLLIAALGWVPETADASASDRYTANAGEMLSWLRETNPELASQIEDCRSLVLRPYYEAAINRMLRRAT